MSAAVTHQLIDGFGVRFEVLCGVEDWTCASADVTRAKDPCVDCLMLLELDCAS
jgi:hypothetical protein